MSETEKRIQAAAKKIHNQLEIYYEAWLEMEKIANDMGMTLDTKTAELKPKN